MQRVSSYLKMRVLGAIESAPGESIVARIRHISEQVFVDEDSRRFRFTWRTIQTWYSRYKKDGTTTVLPKPRSDKGKTRKLAPEEVLVVEREGARREQPAGVEAEDLFACEAVQGVDQAVWLVGVPAPRGCVGVARPVRARFAARAGGPQTPGIRPVVGDPQRASGSVAEGRRGG